MRHSRWMAPPGGAGAALAAAALLLPAAPLAAQCANTVVADVVALEQFIWYNRLGAHEPEGMMYALKDDVVGISGAPGPGNARLRPGKRPRPLVLRVNQGDCLQINFTNWLPTGTGGGRTGTRAASVHVVGMQLVTSIQDDGSNVGINATSLVEPGSSRTYKLFAEREGPFLMYSTAQTTGGDGDGGQIAKGLFGAVNVEPRGAQWYRSQLTREELNLATTGTTGGGQPIIDYERRYPLGHPLYPRPIMRMTDGNRIVHSDLYAVITGPNRGNFPPGTYPDDVIGTGCGDPNSDQCIYPNRLKPFRENTVIFHDEIGIVQAFEKIFDSQQFEFTLHGGRDAFAINYGTGGIGAEILANRFGLGPMWDCNDCKFEEFFLSAWAVGDPAMVVDNPPAASFDPNNPPAPGPRATKALYPDDPSNVFHSYLNDHVKIRNVHAGPKEHHIFHLHAHQWLHTPNADGSNYDDSQAIGPAGGYTYEIAFGGAGNRRNTPGDAIYHCHFYPHFAQGMWGLWRVHDVFEQGTVLDASGRPAPGSRALPDGEIAAGTPIPALVPLPTYAMAPMPNATMPGFPFYIPGIPGHRPPKPPLDTRFDGGLPRHVVKDGTASFPALNTRDFSKHDVTLLVNWLPEAGTPAEQAAMNFHAAPGYNTPIADQWATLGFFETNGRTPKPGAPYADPCPINTQNPDSIKAAAFQIDATYNKANWRFPQHRMFALWHDVRDFYDNGRAPEPLFIRVLDRDCIDYSLVNLVPEEYRMDDFQVQTPTDVIGQHIHLMKFDVTASDGAANGWNYEDGALAPGDVRNRIKAIRAANGCAEPTDARDGTTTCPRPRYHPFFNWHTEWLGAQENVQRFWADAIADARRQGTVFTHDHFGPSTHQQTGLYAGFLPEDSGTVWRDPETGVQFGTRNDGGPTSWRADILYTALPDSSFREFGLQIADFALACGREGFATGVGTGYCYKDLPAINPPGKDEDGLPNLLRPPQARGVCPNGIDRPPCPEIISADDPGTMLINYRNEPVALRVRNPATNQQAAAPGGSLARAFASDGFRADARFNNFGPYGARPGELPGDPFTPLLRVYEDDRIVFRLLVGAHEESHQVNLHGTRWLFEPRFPDSGWRNTQGVGISEFWEFNLDKLMTNRRDTIADFLYQSAPVDDIWNGTWGLIRMYRRTQPTLLRLNNLAVSRSLETAEAEAALAPARPDGSPPEYPDPNEPAQWQGASPAPDEAVVAMSSLAIGTDAEADTVITDSVAAGYGTETTGGIDYEVFEYDPDTQTETVVSDDPKAAEKGLVQDATATQTMALRSTSTTSSTSTSSTAWSGSGGSVARGFYTTCPRVSKTRWFDIVATTARQALPGGRLEWNRRTVNGGPLYDPSAIMYVFRADLRRDGTLRAGAPVEPLVLRANAGECILVRLHNWMRRPLLDPAGFNTLPMIVDLFNANHTHPDTLVGLHPQLVAFDVQHADGTEVGVNRRTWVAPGEYRWYVWYAGDVQKVGRKFVATPIEFGATNLASPDRIEHSNKGAAASLIIEPQKSRHYRDPGSHALATIRDENNNFLFREMVLQFHDDVNLRFGSDVTLPRYDCKFEAGNPHDAEEEKACDPSNPQPGWVTFRAGEAVPNLAEAEDPEDSGQKGFNTRTEPLWFRMAFAPNAELDFTLKKDFRNSLKDVQVGGRPQTPILTAGAGQALRIRVLQSGGHARAHVFNLHGHIWEELPYVKNSRFLGPNALSEWKGARDGHGPLNHFDVLPKNGAGGKYRVPGEYLYRNQPSFLFDGGMWGLIKVNSATTTTSPTTLQPTSSEPTSPQTATLQSRDGSARLGACVVDPKTARTICKRR